MQPPRAQSTSGSQSYQMLTFPRSCPQASAPTNTLWRMFRSPNSSIAPSRSVVSRSRSRRCQSQCRSAQVSKANACARKTCTCNSAANTPMPLSSQRCVPPRKWKTARSKSSVQKSRTWKPAARTHLALLSNSQEGNSRKILRPWWNAGYTSIFPARTASSIWVSARSSGSELARTPMRKVSP